VPLSPFGPSTGGLGGLSSPFSSDAGSRLSPFAEGAPPSASTRAALAEAEGPWWKKITLTQVVLVLSFTTIILIMIATFFVVLKMGAISFNDS
jgi:hypothetical protein